MITPMFITSTIIIVIVSIIIIIIVKYNNNFNIISRIQSYKGH